VKPPVLDSAGGASQLMTAPTGASGGKVDKSALRVDAECGQAETIAVREYSSTERQAAASRTPGGDSDPAATHDELSDQFVARAMARRCGEAAALHLEIRRWQEAIGQNRFADIYDSQPDLRDVLGYYVTPGGNFWFATTGTGELAGFAPEQAGRAVRLIRFLRLMHHHQRDLHLLAAADRRRGQGFSAAMPAPPDQGYTNISTARQTLGRYSFANIGHIATSRTAPTANSSRVEFRLWDGSLEPGRIQAQVKMSTAMLDLQIQPISSVSARAEPRR